MSKLPEEFADLERFADWCLPTEEERYAKRLDSTMAEMQELYDAGIAPDSRSRGCQTTPRRSSTWDSRS
jgi:hypothetical protein